jgi:hypothetical protein
MSTRFFSESETLRKLNLPATPRWRAFLREQLNPEQVAGAVVYERTEAESLAHRIADFAAEIIPQQTAEQPPASRHANEPAKLNDRRGPTVNR